MLTKGGKSILKENSQKYFSSFAQVRPTATQLLINGKWVNSITGKTFETLNPSNEKKIVDVQEADVKDVDIAVNAARKAFDQGPWRRMQPKERSRILLSVADQMEKNADELAALESLDNGKPLFASMIDIEFAADLFRYYAGWADKIHGQTIPICGPYFCYTKEEPAGVCALITPWNFPILMASLKLAPCIAAGCTAILKPAEQTPLTALRIGEYFLNAGTPEGVINILPGYGKTAGEALVKHPGVDKIAFTGSTAVGRHILMNAGIKRVTLELGGKSPNIILKDADIDFAVQQANFAAFVNSGQICMAGSRTFVQENIYDKFLEKAVAAARQKKVGDPFDSTSENGPQISDKQMHKILNYIEKGYQQGAKLLCGGKRMEKPGYFIETTVFADVKDHMTIAQEEIFGPVMSVFKFKTIEEAIERANNTEYGLTAGVVTTSIESALEISNALRSGQVFINCWATTSTNTPFGGFKNSGIGRELGYHGLKNFLESKTVIMKRPDHSLP